MVVRPLEQGRVVLDLRRRQISIVRQGHTPWPMASSDC